MTFTEAAAQVLRLVGKPLHYKEITDVAIEKNLLSHVGKSPEVTMGARLAALVKKNDKENPLVRVKPGVFALREWDSKTVDRGLADRTPALEIIAAQEANGELVLPATEAIATAEPVEDEVDAAETELEEGTPPDEEERKRAQIAATATDLFAPEEDDDEPIFGPEAEEEDDDKEEADRDAGGRRRRRRRRRGRGADERGDDLPSYTVSDAPVATGDEEPRVAEREVARERDREPRERERERGDRDRERGDRDRERGDRDRERGDRDRERAERDRERAERDRDRDRDRGAAQPPIEELAGRELADAVANALSAFDRSGGPVPVHKLVEALQRRNRVGDAGHAQVIILAATRADNLRRAGDGQRARFRVVSNRVGLSEWSLDGELLRIERDLSALSDRYREAARRLLLKRIQELPHRAIGELVILLLERMGITSLAPVRRAGAPAPELHLAGTLSTAGGDVRVAVVVRRDGREVGRERVTELRGALHHYAGADAGWLITTGQVLSGAREEAAAPGASPVTLIDGNKLARLCEEHRVAVVSTELKLCVPDTDLLDALRSS